MHTTGVGSTRIERQCVRAAGAGFITTYGTRHRVTRCTPRVHSNAISSLLSQTCLLPQMIYSYTPYLLSPFEEALSSVFVTAITIKVIAVILYEQLTDRKN